MPPVRRLTAILAADVVGYSRLMGMDEEGTLARLLAHRRELVDPRIITPEWRRPIGSRRQRGKRNCNWAQTTEAV